MPRRFKPGWIAAGGLMLLLPAMLIANLFFASPNVARGKALAIPERDEPDALQEVAANRALSDPRVQALGQGHRTELFGVRSVGMQFTERSAECAAADCRQVEIYDFDSDATILAIVNVESGAVLDVLHQPSLRPGINERLSERALQIAFTAPEVIEVVGYQPDRSDWAAMDAGRVGTVCDGKRLCVAVLFDLDKYLLWAFVDLTTETLVDLTWSAIPEDVEGVVPIRANGACPMPGTVNRAGWSLSYETTGTDGLRVYGVSYNGEQVLTSAKLLEWHVDYGGYGFQDYIGCGGGGGGYQINPYGETEVRELLDSGNAPVGFEVVQDFRMASWGNACNYRYEQHYQFYNDGRFRVVGGAFGKGCSNNGIYRPITRIDMAVRGDEGDSFASWDGTVWEPQVEEIRLNPNGPTTAEGYSWRVLDESGVGYTVQQGRQTVGDTERRDNAYMYATLHQPAEGDTDMPAFTAGCCNDTLHGPEQFINAERIDGANLVLWYVPQLRTLVDGSDSFCWTFTPPETYPCFSGPLFVPVATDGGTPTPTASVTATATATSTPTPTATVLPGEMLDYYLPLLMQSP